MNVPHLTHNQISNVAVGYLAQNHPSGMIPVPIEEIIDIKEKIDIIAVENLSDHGIHGYTARDRKTIYVDKDVYQSKNQYRYRFTLAHELSHILIHGDVFKAANYTDVRGFVDFWNSINRSTEQRIEQQGYMLAGYLLVPSIPFHAKYNEFAQEMLDNGMDIAEATPQALKIVAKHIGKQFGVSFAVIHRRAVYESLWGWDDIALD